MRREIPFGLYLILDPAFCGGRDPVEVAETALQAGVRMIQYREKHRSRRETYFLAKELRETTRQAGAFLILNDEVDIAMAVEADGVHLGQEDFPVKEARRILGEGYWIGLSTHSLEEVERAKREPVDYIGFGPVFQSSSKQVRPPLGVEVLRRAAVASPVPVFAIGGITPGNAGEVMVAGARGMAVIQGVLGGPDIAGAVADYRRVIDRLHPRRD
ncbi:MAG: thiamine phosphate synthase [Nitrospirae bacterium]|nr:thiamine phosphate synthase [Nitrospirota bacterium]